MYLISGLKSQNFLSKDFVIGQFHSYSYKNLPQWEHTFFHVCDSNQIFSLQELFSIFLHH